MSDFQRVEYADKREALKNLIEDVTINHGEDFVFYTEPKTAFLTVNSRLQRLEIQQNSSDEIRHIDVYFDGPVDQLSTDIQQLPGLERQGGLQMGVVQRFVVVIHFGVSYDNNGEINNRGDFEDLLEGYNPKGIFPTLREKQAIQDANNTGKTVILSTEANVSLPPVPRPLERGGNERAHYCDFVVFITDM